MNTTVEKWFALSIVLTAPLLYVIAILIINIAYPAIEGSLGAVDAEILLVIASHSMGSACFEAQIYKLFDLGRYI